MDADAQDASPHPPIRGCTNFKLRQLVRAVSRLYDAEIGKAGLKGKGRAASGGLQRRNWQAAGWMDAMMMTKPCNE